jgi:hypothetical protein
MQPYSRFLLWQLHTEVVPKVCIACTEWEAISLCPAEVFELKYALGLGPGQGFEITQDPG